MSLGPDIVGHVEPTLTITPGRERLAAFAEAIGEDRPLYREPAAARLAGYGDIPLPPTYHFSLGLERENPLGFLAERGVDLLKLLHAEQAFFYRRQACAGEALGVSRKVVDYFERKGGALQFVVIETAIADDGGDAVAASRETLVLPRSTPARAGGEPAGGGGAAQGPVVPEERRGFSALDCGEITRETLARFGLASGDLNRVHLDRGAAQAAGYDDVFAQGMLSMALLGRLLTRRVRLERIRSFSVRFHAITPLGAAPVCESWIKDGDPDRRDGTLGLLVRLGDGTVTLSGSATVGSDRRDDVR